jgi:simple sugar transport system permease protein
MSDAELLTLSAILAAMVRAATPLVFAALGELVTERSGVLNLGLEGMMLMGAVAAFAVAHGGGGAVLSIAAGAAAGMAMAALFAFLALGLRANQVACGLALSIFGVGLSAFLGKNLVGTPVDALSALPLPGLSQIPVVGKALFDHDALVYLSVLAAPAIHVFLFRSRAGLILRAVGENHDAAHSIGFAVLRVRLLAVLFGGAMAGLGGAYLSLAYTPLWVENMTSGRGWIALALVVFATWRPARVLLGAYLFGGVTILQLHAQNWGIGVSSQILAMLPYLATVAVLVLISRDESKIKLNAPACLGKVFHSGR